MQQFDEEKMEARGVSNFFDWVKERSHLFRGVTFGTMHRDGYGAEVTVTAGGRKPSYQEADGARVMKQAVAVLLEKPESPWWDDKLTPGVTEGMSEVLRRSLVDVVRAVLRIVLDHQDQRLLPDRRVRVRY